MKVVRKVGISELVASLMTLLITISLGSLILYVINDYINSVQVTLRYRLEELRMLSLRSLDLIMAVGNETTNEVTIVVASGRVEVRILAVYINEVLIRNSTYFIRPLEIVVVRARSPVALRSGEPFIVKVVHEGGKEVGYGFTYK